MARFEQGMEQHNELRRKIGKIPVDNIDSVGQRILQRLSTDTAAGSRYFLRSKILLCYFAKLQAFSMLFVGQIICKKVLCQIPFAPFLLSFFSFYIFYPCVSPEEPFQGKRWETLYLGGSKDRQAAAAAFLM